MAEYNKNSPQPIQSSIGAQTSILDLLLFPGFTRVFAAVQQHLLVDLNLYGALLCILGLLAFISRRICAYLAKCLMSYSTSTVHVTPRDDAYKMLMTWISAQAFAQNARSSLVTTDLVSLSPMLGMSNDRLHDKDPDKDPDKLALYYTPWNGRFLFRYKNHLLMFRREYQADTLCAREEISITCFSSSPKVLKDLFAECGIEYSKLIRDKTSIHEHQDGAWTRSTVTDIRPMSTIMLSENSKEELLKDIGDFLEPTIRKWYSHRGIPYRRGYLFYGPPGTGKSSLSLSIAGLFGLSIYILSLSSVSEDSLKSLFAKLPSRCLVLLEDIDAASTERPRDMETDNSRQVVIGSSTQKSKSADGKVSLSALLNVIDGVASQKGRILIMNTNHITRIDEALIQPGRIDRKVELGLAERDVVAKLFCMVYKPMQDEVAHLQERQSDALTIYGKRISKAMEGEGEKDDRVECLAKEFAARIPKLKYSPAEILSFLLKYKQSPEDAISNVETWIVKMRKGEEG